VLLEALLAVIVTSVGFIGAARLQTYSLALNGSGQTRQKASLLAYQMADRVRVNSLGLAAYNNPASGSKACLTASAGCTAAQLAVADYTEWMEDVTSQLKGGTGTICLDSTPNDGTSSADPQCDGLGSTLAIKLWWEDTVGASRLITTIRP
jgi:type IV pilus assembly protein PilV